MAIRTPPAENILANVAAQLALITTTADFRTSEVTTDRQFINRESIGAGTKLPALTIFGQEIDFENATVGNTPMRIGTLKFSVQGILKAFSAPATEIVEFSQDVMEKLYADRTRGGYAINTHIVHVEFGGEAMGNKYGSPPFVLKPFVGFLMNVETQYYEIL